MNEDNLAKLRQWWVDGPGATPLTDDLNRIRDAKESDVPGSYWRAFFLILAVVVAGIAATWYFTLPVCPPGNTTGKTAAGACR